MRSWIIGGVLILVSMNALADVVEMRHGSKIECVVVQENPNSIVIRRGYGTMMIARSQIASISKSPVLTETDVAPTTRPAAGQRIPSWNDVLAVLVKQKWANDIRQIPATVIDVGVMRNVPYQSYRCGADYEMNIYGDPDRPAGIEIGIYRTLLSNPQAQQNCIDLVASVLTEKTDAALVRTLDRGQDIVTRNGLTFEITPQTSPDAYGGWWVSVYNEKELDAARATDTELNEISVARATPVTATPPPPQTINRPPVIAPSAQASVQPAAARSTYDPPSAWTPAEIAMSRPSSTAGAGRVYVRGYYRKDGTYVRPYTRRR